MKSRRPSCSWPAMTAAICRVRCCIPTAGRSLTGSGGAGRRREMPAKSKAQQKAAGAALSAKRGDTPKSKLKGASREMADSMSEKQLEDFAKGSRKGKPEHVD